LLVEIPTGLGSKQKRLKTCRQSMRFLRRDMTLPKKENQTIYWVFMLNSGLRMLAAGKVMLTADCLMLNAGFEMLMAKDYPKNVSNYFFTFLKVFLLHVPLRIWTNVLLPF